MHHLAYISKAVVPFNEEELIVALVNWRDRNKSADITGMLLYNEGNIVQLLEGSKQHVLALFAAIEHDRRHCNISKIADGPVAQREFADWSMGFKVVGAEAIAKIRGYVDPDQSNFLGLHTIGPVVDSSLVQLLKSFAERIQDPYLL